ncbi:MAG: hypothetical protein LBJ74_05700 [Heliobacteriaceae bacterium]|jgi:hypothetical protein|nr:hypothetical protein [Heliobacteriaceae bacterium]
MGKFIAFLLIVGIVAWVYYNVDFANFKTDATGTFKKEKTIMGVDRAREQNNADAQKALEGF